MFNVLVLSVLLPVLRIGTIRGQSESPGTWNVLLMWEGGKGRRKGRRKGRIPGQHRIWDRTQLLVPVRSSMGFKKNLDKLATT